MKYIVFGLGSYGAALSARLVELGHEVFGVDSLPERTERSKNHITYVVTLDATNRDAILDLPLLQADAVIIAIGENEGTIILVAALLKQIGVRRIICRVMSALQKTVLETMGLNEFVYPEKNSADRLAHTLSIAGVLDSFRVCDQYRILEVHLPGRLMGSTVGDAKFDDYDIMLVTVKRKTEEKNLLGAIHEKIQTLGRISATLRFRPEDRLVLFGEPRKIKAFVDHL